MASTKRKKKEETTDLTEQEHSTQTTLTEEVDNTTQEENKMSEEITPTVAEETTETPAENGETASKRKKLSKAIEGTVVKITVLGGTKGEMSFDFATLPEKIQAAFGPFGLGHKLGDSAAGTSGAEAEAAIQKVWEGLVAGDWSVRAPAQPKIAISTIASNLGNLSAEEQEAAKAALAKLGINL